MPGFWPSKGFVETVCTDIASQISLEIRQIAPNITLPQSLLSYEVGVRFSGEQRGTSQI